MDTGNDILIPGFYMKFGFVFSSGVFGDFSFVNMVLTFHKYEPSHGLTLSSLLLGAQRLLQLVILHAQFQVFAFSWLLFALIFYTFICLFICECICMGMHVKSEGPCRSMFFLPSTRVPEIEFRLSVLVPDDLSGEPSCQLCLLGSGAPSLTKPMLALN